MDLLRDGRRVRSVLAQPERLALLACLASAQDSLAARADWRAAVTWALDPRRAA